MRQFFHSHDDCAASFDRIRHHLSMGCRHESCAAGNASGARIRAKLRALEQKLYILGHQTLITAWFLIGFRPTIAQTVRTGHAHVSPFLHAVSCGRSEAYRRLRPRHHVTLQLFVIQVDSICCVSTWRIRPRCALVRPTRLGCIGSFFAFAGTFVVLSTIKSIF